MAFLDPLGGLGVDAQQLAQVAQVRLHHVHDVARVLAGQALSLAFGGLVEDPGQGYQPLLGVLGQALDGGHLLGGQRQGHAFFGNGGGKAQAGHGGTPFRRGGGAALKPHYMKVGAHFIAKWEFRTQKKAPAHH
ncbi:hypothetical protein D3C80_1249860 [compost metagenome]